MKDFGSSNQKVSPIRTIATDSLRFGNEHPPASEPAPPRTHAPKTHVIPPPPPSTHASKVPQPPQPIQKGVVPPPPTLASHSPKVSQTTIPKPQKQFSHPHDILRDEGVVLGAPHERTPELPKPLTQKEPVEKPVIPQKEARIEHESFTDAERGSFVTDKKHRHTSLGEIASQAWHEWWGKTRSSLEQSLEKIPLPEPEEKPKVVSHTERAQVIEEAAQFSTQVPHDDHAVVTEKLKQSVPQTNSVQSTPFIIKKNPPLSTSSWSHTAPITRTETVVDKAHVRAVPENRTQVLDLRTPPPTHTEVPSKKQWGFITLKAEKAHGDSTSPTETAKSTTSKESAVTAPPLTTSHKHESLGPIPYQHISITEPATSQISPKESTPSKHPRVRLKSEEGTIPPVPQMPIRGHSFLKEVGTVAPEAVQAKNPTHTSPRIIATPILKKSFATHVPQVITNKPSTEEHVHAWEASHTEQPPHTIVPPQNEFVPPLPLTPEPPHRTKETSERTSPSTPIHTTPAPIPAKTIVTETVATEKSDSLPINESGRKHIRIMLYVLIGLFAGISGMLTAYVFYTRTLTPQDPATATTVTNPSTIVSTDVSVPIPFTDIHSEFIERLSTVTKQETHRIAEYYPTVSDTEDTEPLTPETIMSVLAPSAPLSFVRSLGTGMVIGSVETSSREPFIVLEAHNFDASFMGMLSWEPTMSSDLAPLFGDPIVVQGKSTPFIDGLAENKSIRILKDATGKERIIYAFANSRYVVITTTAEALSVIITNLR